jgi:PAS domain S-box-containing protein
MRGHATAGLEIREAEDTSSAPGRGRGVEDLAALRRYAILAHHCRDVMLFVRRDDGRILEANEAARAAYGYSRDELLARTIYDLRERASEGLTSQQMAQADAHGLRFETIHRRKDGSTFPVEVTSQGALVEGEHTLVSVIRDISERRRAEVALRQSKAQLLTIVENLHEGVVVSDLDGNLLHWNRVALDLHGFETLDECRTELPRLARIFELSTLDGQVLALEDWPLARILRGEPLGEVELRIRCRAGGWERIFRYGGRLVRDPEGGAEMAVVTVRDVTERKQEEADRERLQVQLADARRLESIGRLAGGIAHDFNNLLAVILSCARAVRDDLASGAPAEPEDLEEIEAAGVRARDLTRQLLAFARRQASEPAPLDLNAVVRGSETLLRRVVGDAVELAVDLDPALAAASCDPVQLEHALLNLVINARDAMPRGGRLRLATANAQVDERLLASRPGLRPGPYVHLSVADSGLGMTPEVRAQVFEPFFTTKPEGQGTGLGLAVIYGVVKQCGGFIQVESEVGRGTTFDLYLPACPGPGAPGPRAPTTS